MPNPKKAVKHYFDPRKPPSKDRTFNSFAALDIAESSESSSGSEPSKSAIQTDPPTVTQPVLQSQSNLQQQQQQQQQQSGSVNRFKYTESFRPSSSNVKPEAKWQNTISTKFGTKSGETPLGLKASSALPQSDYNHREQALASPRSITGEFHQQNPPKKSTGFRENLTGHHAHPLHQPQHKYCQSKVSAQSKVATGAAAATNFRVAGAVPDAPNVPAVRPPISLTTKPPTHIKTPSNSSNSFRVDHGKRPARICHPSSNNTYSKKSQDSSGGHSRGKSEQKNDFSGSYDGVGAARSKNPRFPKVRGYNEAEAKKAERADRRELEAEFWLGKLPSDVLLDFNEVLSYNRVPNGLSIQNIFGQRTEGLNEIRTGCRVKIAVASESGSVTQLKFSSETKERVDRAIEQYRTKIREAEGRQRIRESRFVWNGWASAAATVKLLPSPEHHSTDHGDVEAVPAVSTYSSNIGYEICPLNFGKLQNFISTSLEEASSFTGVIRLRINLGSVLIEKTPTCINPNSIYPNEFDRLIEESEEADFLSFSHHLMRSANCSNLILARRLIAPRDAFVRDLDKVPCTFCASFFFEHPSNHRVYQLRVKFGALEHSSIDAPVRERDEWVRFESNDGGRYETKNKPKSLMDVVLACPSQHGLSWKFDLSVANRAREESLPEDWIRFAEGIRLSDCENVRLLAGKPDFLSFPKWFQRLPLREIHMIRTSEYRMHGSGYILNVDRVLRMGPFPRTEFNTLAVYHEKWDSLMLPNERKADTEWGPVLQEFFPLDDGSKVEDKGDGHHAGLGALFQKLEAIEGAFTGTYKPSSPVTVKPKLNPSPDHPQKKYYDEEGEDEDDSDDDD